MATVDLILKNKKVMNNFFAVLKLETKHQAIKMTSRNKIIEIMPQ